MVGKRVGRCQEFAMKRVGKRLGMWLENSRKKGRNVVGKRDGKWQEKGQEFGSKRVGIWQENDRKKGRNVVGKRQENGMNLIGKLQEKGQENVRNLVRKWQEKGQENVRASNRERNSQPHKIESLSNLKSGEYQKKELEAIKCYQ